jgi:hypothetical protein
MSIDGAARHVVNQVRLEDDCLALSVHPKEPKTGAEDLVNPLRILVDVQDRDA